jgi:hypothetical protein
MTFPNVPGQQIKRVFAETFDDGPGNQSSANGNATTFGASGSRTSPG